MKKRKLKRRILISAVREFVDAIHKVGTLKLGLDDGPLQEPIDHLCVAFENLYWWEYREEE